MTHFNPRPPWGGRPVAQCILNACEQISIHALRGEGDRNSCRYGGRTFISIHALRGEGDQRSGTPLFIPCLRFQSTPSVGRATLKMVKDEFDGEISIHALRGEGDAYTRDL